MTLLFSTLFISTLVLFSDIPEWCFFCSIVFWVWKTILYFLKKSPPSRYLTGVLSVVFLVLVYLDFKSFLGKEPATSYLVVLVGLKFLEFRDESEKEFLILLGFFLVTAKFLFSYDLVFLFISVLEYLVLTTHLLPISWLQKNRRESLTYLFKVLALSFPLALIFFVFFPRITKELLELPVGQQGLSGFSDTLNPGSLSKLNLNNEVAFRLELTNSEIDVQQLYLRGLVLEQNRDMSWFTNKNYTKLTKNNIFKNPDYSVLMEPTQQNYLFALENTEQLTSDQLQVIKDENKIFYTTSFIEKKLYVTGSLATENKNESVKMNPVEMAETRLRNLKVNTLNFSSEENKVKLQELIETWKSKSSYAVMNDILRYFKKNNFKYTLTPEYSSHLTLDYFLFNSKKGYCEHFAASLALLLRLSGIPARVVVGYLGGEYNHQGNFWIVRQKDAHAWVEFLNETNHWIRSDATQSVAPERIELGFDLFSQMLDQKLTLDEVKKRTQKFSYFSSLVFWLENLNYQWNLFLLKNDFENQKIYLRKISSFMKNLINNNLIIFIFLFFSLLTLFTLTLLKVNPLKKPLLYREKAFFEINSWAKQIHVEKLNHESPTEWKKRIIGSSGILIHAESIMPQLESVFEKWLLLSYGPELTKSMEQTLFRDIKTRLKLIKSFSKVSQKKSTNKVTI